MKLPVNSVREDPAVQLRGGLDMDRVQAMADFVEQGGTLPPITVVGADNLLADGHHRLYLAVTTGQLEIEANRLPGGMSEAVAIALAGNKDAVSLPLTRTQRNAGIKLLLKAGWTQEQIATASGVHQTTIMDIHNALAMRGEVTKRTADGSGHRTPKPVTVLPKAVHERLNDTTLTRIVDLVDFDKQAEFAAAVAAVENMKDPTITGLSEPRVREAAALLKSNGLTPTEAVQRVTPQIMPMPVTLPEVARQVRRRLERFLEESTTVEGTERDFWQVLDVLAANADRIPLEAKGLANLLAEIAVKADHYAGALRSQDAIEAVTA